MNHNLKFELKNKDWGEFYLQSIFNPTKGDQNKMSSLLDGNIPLISAKNGSNGLKGLVSKNNKKIFPKFTLSLNNDGDGGAGFCYFQPFDYLLDSHVTSLASKQPISKECLLFISRCITNQRDKFGHGYAINSNRLTAFKIMLPITKKGLPDFNFMEKFIKQKEAEKKEKYYQFLKGKIEKLKNYKEVESLEQKEWNEFFIEQIAEIISGKDIYEKERIKGKTPYITSTANKNGIGYFVGNDNKTLESNCLSVNRNGSVGYSFYHPYNALFSNDCRKLRLHKANNYCGIFISHQISIQREKYGYGYKMGTARLKRQRIMLPIDKSGLPDYEYMENYIKKIEYQKLKKYLEKVEMNVLKACSIQ